MLGTCRIIGRDFSAFDPRMLLVIRAAQNRRSEGTYDSLQALISHAPLSGEFTLDVPARPENSARQAHLQVRFAQTTLCLPHRSKIEIEAITREAFGPKKIGRNSKSKQTNMMWDGLSRLRSYISVKDIKVLRRHRNEGDAFDFIGEHTPIARGCPPNLIRYFF